MNDQQLKESDSAFNSTGSNGVVTLVKSYPKYDGEGPQKVMEDGSLRRDPGFLLRYATIESINERNVTLAWDGLRHVFDRRTGRCIESELGLMTDFSLEDPSRDLPQTSSKRETFAGSYLKKKSPGPDSVVKAILQVLKEAPEAQPLVIAALQRLQNESLQPQNESLWAKEYSDKKG